MYNERLHGNPGISHGGIMATVKKIIKRSGDIVDFSPERITNAIYRAAVSVGGRDLTRAENLGKQVVKLLEKNTPVGHIPTIEEVQDLVEKVLIENGHAKVAKEYILYREERARSRGERATRAGCPSENIPWAKIWDVLNWAIDHNINTVEKLNWRIARGEYPQIVHETEKMYNEDVENSVEMIAQRKDEIKLVIITGPSSSGKTTTTMKVGQRLKRIGFSLVTLNVDNYFFDLEMHPKDEFGDYDFETPQALDLNLINEHLDQLVRGNEVKIPFYDFKMSKRFLNQTPLRLKPKDIILIDSLHGLYPDMTKDLPNDVKFRMYLEPLLQMKDNVGKYIRWTDLRLIRRMLRDASHRAYDPRRTLEHWHYVRSSEMRHIIPNITQTDYIINTGLPYELPIYSAKMLKEFSAWMEEYRDNPLRQDAFQRASRIFELLHLVTPIEDNSPIPSDSLLREFIGGSCYKY
jgi:uridine kinase